MQRQFPVALAAFTALLFSAAAVKAAPILSLSVGGTVLSNGSGVITDTVASGAFAGSVLTATGFPFEGSDQEPQIDLGGVAKASAAGTLVIMITQTNNQNSGLDWAFDSEVSDSLITPGLTIAFAGYASASNVAFGQDIALSPGSFSSTGSLSEIANVVINQSQFAVTEVITLSSIGKSSVGSSFDASLSGVDPVPGLGVDVVPEPPSIILFAIGLAGVILINRRRQAAVAD